MILASPWLPSSGARAQTLLLLVTAPAVAILATSRQKQSAGRSQAP